MSKTPKYRNVKVEVDSHKFDSRKEAKEYGILKMRKLAGEIKDFSLQETYRLDINGVHVCNYIADFVIVELTGLKTVIDVKSEITRKNPVYRLKKKLMQAIHNIDIKEI